MNGCDRDTAEQFRSERPVRARRYRRLSNVALWRFPCCSLSVPDPRHPDRCRCQRWLRMLPRRRRRATGSSPDGPQVVLDWERILFRTVYSATPIPVGVPVLGFVSVALHRAATRSAHVAAGSETAAVATAAHNCPRALLPWPGRPARGGSCGQPGRDQPAERPRARGSGRGGRRHAREPGGRPLPRPVVPLPKAARPRRVAAQPRSHRHARALAGLAHPVVRDTRCPWPVRTP